MTQHAKQLRFRERPEICPRWRCATHGEPLVDLRVRRQRDDVLEAIAYACSCTTERIVGRVKPPEHFEAIDRHLAEASAPNSRFTWRARA